MTGKDGGGQRMHSAGKNTKELGEGLQCDGIAGIWGGRGQTSLKRAWFENMT